MSLSWHTVNFSLLGDGIVSDCAKPQSLITLKLNALFLKSG
jgi:hypothetical protein